MLLSAEKQNQIFIPAGFAHGFSALTDTVQFLYKCSDFYDPGDEHGILWNDPDLGDFLGRCRSPGFRKRREVFHPRRNAARISSALLLEMNPKILLIGKNGQIGRDLNTLPRLGDVVATDRQQLDLSKPGEIRNSDSRRSALL